MNELPKECGVCEYNHQEGEFLCCCHKDASDGPGIVPARPICPASGRAMWCPLEEAEGAVKGIDVATAIHRTWRERKEAMSQQGGGSPEGLEPIEEIPGWLGFNFQQRGKLNEIIRKVNMLMENC